MATKATHISMQHIAIARLLHIIAIIKQQHTIVATANKLHYTRVAIVSLSYNYSLLVTITMRNIANYKHSDCNFVRQDIAVIAVQMSDYKLKVSSLEFDL